MQNLIAVPILLILSAAALRANESLDWHTGNQFRRQLEAETAITWSSNPLRRAIANLSRTQRVAIFLDRRIDPSQRIDLTVADGPLEQVLTALADSLRVGICKLDPVVYIGPSDMADRLATIAANRRDDVGRLPSAIRTRWRVAEWSWDRLTTPQELISDLAEETGCRIVNPEVVPHDLWPATDLPAMAAADRLSLLLAGFSLTFEVSRDGTEARLVVPPDKVSWQQTYRPQRNIRQALSALAEQFPQTTVERLGRRLRVTGSYEDHYRIKRWLRGELPRRTSDHSGENRRYTLAIEKKPADVVIKSIAEQLKLSLEIAPSLTAKLQEHVTFQVRDVKLEELLHAALDPVQVRFRLNDRKLILAE